MSLVAEGTFCKTGDRLGGLSKLFFGESSFSSTVGNLRSSLVTGSPIIIPKSSDESMEADRLFKGSKHASSSEAGSSLSL